MKPIRDYPLNIIEEAAQSAIGRTVALVSAFCIGFYFGVSAADEGSLHHAYCLALYLLGFFLCSSLITIVSFALCLSIFVYALFAKRFFVEACFGFSCTVFLHGFVQYSYSEPLDRIEFRRLFLFLAGYFIVYSGLRMIPMLYRFQRRER